jgi:hypothetical protein
MLSTGLNPTSFGLSARFGEGEADCKKQVHHRPRYNPGSATRYWNDLLQRDGIMDITSLQELLRVAG